MFFVYFCWPADEKQNVTSPPDSIQLQSAAGDGLSAVGGTHSSATATPGVDCCKQMCQVSSAATIQL